MYNAVSRKRGKIVAVVLHSCRQAARGRLYVLVVLDWPVHICAGLLVIRLFGFTSFKTFHSYYFSQV